MLCCAVLCYKCRVLCIKGAGITELSGRAGGRAGWFVFCFLFFVFCFLFKSGYSWQYNYVTLSLFG